MGVLPFLSTGEVKGTGGPPLATDVPVSVWPSTGRNTEVGRAYDHQGEAALAFADALQGSNRRLTVDGVTYAVVEAVVHPFVPHVALLLRKMDASGNG